MSRIFVFLSLFYAAVSQENAAKKILPDHIMRWRYGIPEDNKPVHFHVAFAGVDGMTITWETDSDTNTHICYYGENATNLTTFQSGTSRTYGTIYSHNVILKNLKPHTIYYYSCGDATSGMSEIKNFLTAPQTGDKTPFTLAVIGDMGIRQSNGVVDSMEKRISTYDWVLHIGDVGYADDYYLYRSTYEQVYATFMEEIENVSSTKPFMVLPGNHEATCNEFTPHVCPNYLKNFTAYRTRWHMPSLESNGIDNMWYSFDFGPIHFIQISTETDFKDAPEGPDKRLRSGPFGDQLTWLSNDLAKANANRALVPWIIVSGHRPIWYSADGVIDNNAVRNAFVDILTKYQIDIYFAGHEHNYERYYPITSNGKLCQNNYNNSICPIYIVNGAGGNVEGHQKGRGSPDWLAYRNDNDFGWGRLTLQNVNTLLWEFITEDDLIVDSITITKNIYQEKKQEESPFSCCR